MNWSEGIQRPMRWVQPRKLKMNYELVRGNDVIATLRFKSSWGSLATLENADGCWTLKRSVGWQTRVTVRTCGSEADIATFKCNSWKGGGTLELPGGRRILATTNMWQTQLEFHEESGECLVRLKYDSFWCTSAALDVSPAGQTAPETSWITALGWYVMVMMQMDAVSCAAVVTVPVVT